MRKINFRKAAIWVLAVLPVLMVSVCYKALPQQVPVQWQLHGIVKYGDKSEIWLIAGMSLLFAVLSNLSKIDPKKENYKKFQKEFEGFMIVMMAFLCMMTGIILLESFYPGHISVGKVVVGAIGIIFLYAGNIMPKIKMNFFMGIKNPWTLSDTEVWNKTHHISGILWVIGGICMLFMAFLLEEKAMFYSMMTVIIMMIAIPTVMSYIWYKDSRKN